MKTHPCECTLTSWRGFCKTLRPQLSPSYQNYGMRERNEKTFRRHFWHFAEPWHPFVSPTAPQHISFSYRVCMAAHPPVWSPAPQRWLVKPAITWHGSHPGKRQQQQQRQQPRRARGMLTQHTWSPTPHWKRPSIAITCKTHFKKKKKTLHFRHDNRCQEEASRLKVCSYHSLLVIS